MASNATEKREREMVNDCECALADDYAWDDAMRKDAGGNDVRANLCAHHSLSRAWIQNTRSYKHTHKLSGARIKGHGRQKQSG